MVERRFCSETRKRKQRLMNRIGYKMGLMEITRNITMDSHGNLPDYTDYFRD